MPKIYILKLFLGAGFVELRNSPLGMVSLRENIRPIFITRKVCHSCWVVSHRSWIHFEFLAENAAVSIYSVAAAEDKPVRFAARIFLVCLSKRHLRMNHLSNDDCSRSMSASQVRCWRCRLMIRVMTRWACRSRLMVMTQQVQTFPAVLGLSRS